MQTSARLADKFEPNTYDIYLKLDPEKLEFKGKCLIKGRLKQASNKIQLNSLDLDIADTSITIEGAEHEVGWKISENNHVLTLKLDEAIPKDTDCEAQISYSGKITRTMEAIYPSYYKDGGKDKVLLSTQLESHHAREVFPCIDEPSAKAVFNLKLESPDGLTVIGNTPVKKQKKSTGKYGKTLITEFEPTPRMSTYLLAFVVGELEYIESTTKHGVLVRVFSTPHHKESLNFALKTAVGTLEFFTDYYQIPYPLSKSDHVAIPEFAAGAMENWGLITYRESALLLDERHSSLANKKRVTEVIAHELAHQWFGNLVTMKWWDDLWLNESFATYMANLAMDNLHPDWKIWVDFLEEEVYVAMSADAQVSTRSIIAKVEDPREINELFDPAITYAKGASVLYMLAEFMGKNEFQKGIIKYLNKYSYGNATHQDLWECLQSVSGKPIVDFMESWTKRPGFPLLNVNFEQSNINLSQQRFVISKSSYKDNQLWPIPVTFAKSDKTYLMTERKISIADPSPERITKLNHKQSGFYRTNYKSEHLNQLKDHIASKKLGAEDRMGILDDASEIAKSGHGSTVAVLDLLESYRNEDYPAVWGTLAGFTSSLWKVMDDDKFRELMKLYGRFLVNKQLERLGFSPRDEDTHFDTLLRPTVLGLASKFDHQEVISFCKEEFSRWQGGGEIDANIRGVVYATIARKGDQKIFDLFRQKHKEAIVTQEKQRLAAAMTAFEDTNITKQALDMIMTDEVRLQDAISWIALLFRNRHSREQAWQWYKENWEWIEEHFGKGHLYSYFVSILSVFSDRQRAKEIEEFFEDKNQAGIKRSISQSLEQIRWQADWRQRDLKEIIDWFDNKDFNASGV